MLPILPQTEFESLDDAALVWACFEPIPAQVRGKSLQVKRAVYDQLNPSGRALYMVQVVRGHAQYGVLHLLGTIAYVLEQPNGLRALQDGFAYFGAAGMVELLASMAELFREVQALGSGAEENPAIQDAARQIDQSLATQLDDALRLMAGYIRNHPAEFVEFAS